MLCEQHLVSPTEFGQSKKRVVHSKKGRKDRPCKHQKKKEHNINDNLIEHVQSVTSKVINSRFKAMGINDKKRFSFKVGKANK